MTPNGSGAGTSTAPVRATPIRTIHPQWFSELDADEPGYSAASGIGATVSVPVAGTLSGTVSTVSDGVSDDGTARRSAGGVASGGASGSVLLSAQSSSSSVAAAARRPNGTRGAVGVGGGASTVTRTHSGSVDSASASVLSLRSQSPGLSAAVSHHTASVDSVGSRASGSQSTGTAVLSGDELLARSSSVLSIKKLVPAALPRRQQSHDYRGYGMGGDGSGGAGGFAGFPPGWVPDESGRLVMYRSVRRAKKGAAAAAAATRGKGVRKY